MNRRRFGRFGEISALALGGAGVASHWGAVPRAEGIATLRAAVEAGIDLLDLAPKYGNLRAEEMVGEAFVGHLPAGVRVLTKVLFDPGCGDLGSALEQSLAASLARMRLARVDFLLLHNQVVPDERAGQWPGMAWSVFAREVRPHLAAMAAAGRIAGWGMSAIGASSMMLRALADDDPPQVIEAIANPLDALGNLHTYAEPARPREIIAAAAACGTAVLGVRAAGAGALTTVLDRALPEDHPVARDYQRAEPLRAHAAQVGCTPAMLSLRYALAMPGVCAVVLGVKDRVELAESLAAESAGALSPAGVAAVDAVVGSEQKA